MNELFDRFRANVTHCPLRPKPAGVLPRPSVSPFSVACPKEHRHGKANGSAAGAFAVAVQVLTPDRIVSSDTRPRSAGVRWPLSASSATSVPRNVIN